MLVSFFASILRRIGATMSVKSTPVQVRELMLDHPGRELVEGLRLLLQVLIVVFDRDTLGTADIGIDARHAEAAFVVLAHLRALLRHHRVDDSAAEAFQIRIDVRHDVAVDHGDALADPDLGRCQAAAFRIVQGIPEVLHQDFEAGFVGQVGRSGDFAQHFRAVEINRLYHFFLSR